jgi:hypothetical protein
MKMSERQRLMCLLIKTVPLPFRTIKVIAKKLVESGVTVPVRCKDCIHFDPQKALRPGGIWCEYWGTDPDPEDWCCKGERKKINAEN